MRHKLFTCLMKVRKQSLKKVYVVPMFLSSLCFDKNNKNEKLQIIHQ